MNSPLRQIQKTLSRRLFMLVILKKLKQSSMMKQRARKSATRVNSQLARLMKRSALPRIQMKSLRNSKSRVTSLTRTMLITMSLLPARPTTRIPKFTNTSSTTSRTLRRPLRQTIQRRQLMYCQTTLVRITRAALPRMI